MTPATLAKAVIAGVGFVLVMYGARMDNARIRWAGIACFGLAVILRLSKRPADGDTDPPDDDTE